MSRCTCVVDVDSCPIHDWGKEVEVPNRKQELREREIRRNMRAAGNGRKKSQF